MGKSSNGFGSFGGFSQAITKDPFKLKPITTEFSRGSVPNSIYSANRESAWTRWRRGYEIATASLHDNNYVYNFKYTVPFASGVLPPGTEYPDINGTFAGFPTTNKEFGIHWAGTKKSGSVRFDQVDGYSVLVTQYWLDAQFTDYENIGQWLDDDAKQQSFDLYIESVTEDNDYWYVKLNGAWSSGNKLPPPLYVDISQAIEGLKALNGEVLEDRILEANGEIIDRDTINPIEQKRYGYVQAVLVDTNEETGILKLRKAGSVEATPDRALVTPSTRPPNVGRYFITGARYCCTCQDFTRREYSYMMDLGKSNKKAFPRSAISSVKPGRNELLKRLGIVDNAAMTQADVDRILEIIAPSENLTVPGTVTDATSVDLRSARDSPGVYSEFGSLYLRTTSNPGLTGSTAEGMPSYEDYAATNNVITSLTDIWSPVLDEMRYCKHIYALRFQDGVFPPEPSDSLLKLKAWQVGSKSLLTNTKKIIVQLQRI